jgi:hypothetical protein
VVAALGTVDTVDSAKTRWGLRILIVIIVLRITPDPIWGVVMSTTEESKVEELSF